MPLRVTSWTANRRHAPTPAVRMHVVLTPPPASSPGQDTHPATHAEQTSRAPLHPAAAVRSHFCHLRDPNAAEDTTRASTRGSAPSASPGFVITSDTPTCCCQELGSRPSAARPFPAPLTGRKTEPPSWHTGGLGCRRRQQRGRAARPSIAEPASNGTTRRARATQIKSQLKTMATALKF